MNKKVIVHLSIIGVLLLSVNTYGQDKNEELYTVSLDSIGTCVVNAEILFTPTIIIRGTSKLVGYRKNTSALYKVKVDSAYNNIHLIENGSVIYVIVGSKSQKLFERSRFFIITPVEEEKQIFCSLFSFNKDCSEIIIKYPFERMDPQRMVVRSTKWYERKIKKDRKNTNTK